MGWPVQGINCNHCVRNRPLNCGGEGGASHCLGQGIDVIEIVDRSRVCWGGNQGWRRSRKGKLRTARHTHRIVCATQASSSSSEPLSRTIRQSYCEKLQPQARRVALNEPVDRRMLVWGAAYPTCPFSGAWDYLKSLPEPTAKRNPARG
jgi:hypothetical protein